MPTVSQDVCQKKSPHMGQPYVKAAPDDLELMALWNYKRPWQSKKERCVDWFYMTRSQYDLDRRLTRVFHWCHRPRILQRPLMHAVIGFAAPSAEQLRGQFSALVEQWRRETKFSSSVDEKILHSAYQSIIAMGKAAVPLVLEELQARRGHWFWALHFMTGIDPVPEGANVDTAREVWIQWGKREGYLK